MYRINNQQGELLVDLSFPSHPTPQNESSYHLFLDIYSLSEDDNSRERNYNYENLTADGASNRIIDAFDHIPALKTVSEDTLVEMIGNADENETLAVLLEKNGYSTTISEISFSHNFNFKKINLNGITFKNCIFDWPLFSENRLINVTFISCELNNACFLNSSLWHCQFIKSTLIEVSFCGSNVLLTHFTDSICKNSSFEDAKLYQSIFKDTTLSGTHFLQAQINNVKIQNCDLKNTVFFETEMRFDIDPLSKSSHKITKPVAIQFVLPEKKGLTVPKAFEKLQNEAHTVALKVNAYPATISREKVKIEVESAIAQLDKKTDSSIGEMLMENANLNYLDQCVERRKFLEKAQIIARNVDGILLPGGEDIPSKLYGINESVGKDWEISDIEEDYRRSLFEFALIKESIKKGIPLMGLCRGFQITNVYFGAQLDQHVEGHLMVHQQLKLKDDSTHGLFGALKTKSSSIVSVHHQAVSSNLAKKYIKPIFIYKDVVKGVEPIYSGAAPLIALQSHPELNQLHPEILKSAEEKEKALEENREHAEKIEKDNRFFWKLFSDGVYAYAAKKKTLDFFRNSI